MQTTWNDIPVSSVTLPSGGKDQRLSKGRLGIDNASRAIGTKIVTIMPLNQVNKIGAETKRQWGICRRQWIASALGAIESKSECNLATLAAGHGQRYLSSSQSLAAQYRLNSQLKPLEGAQCGRWANCALSGHAPFHAPARMGGVAV